VLVTGVNGIRKSTALGQPWFRAALGEALVVAQGSAPAAELGELPHAGDSFFRQLDYVMATVASAPLRELYAALGPLGAAPSAEDVAAYAEVKDAIFVRHRTTAEAVGLLLVRAAQRERLNVLIETSGRDLASWRLVDRLFPHGYRKLALRFETSDLAGAERSVEARMRLELHEGAQAVALGEAREGLRAAIETNRGGPYGPHVLAGVQRDGDAVWRRFDKADEFAGWHRATLLIEPSLAEPWSCRARLAQGGGSGERHLFVDPAQLAQIQRGTS
jgi:hypothetical protein